MTWMSSTDVMQACHSCSAAPEDDRCAVHAQALLAQLECLPKNVQAVDQLLKQGCLPVAQADLATMSHLTKQLVVGSSGKFANFCSSYIENGGLVDATGKVDFMAALKAICLFASRL